MTQRYPIRFALKWNIYGYPPDTPFSEYLKIAQAADELGFDGVYIIDHLMLSTPQMLGFSAVADPERPSFPEAWTALAAAAAVTKRVRLGPQVSPVALRNPVFLAKMGANVDRISNGRLVMQLGTGWNPPEYEAFGFDFDERFSVRYQKMLEGVEVILKLWTDSGPSSFEGEHYRLKAAPGWPKPVQQPRPPIWFGGTGKKVQEAVARYGDAWSPAAPHYTGLDVGEYRAGLDNIRRLAEQRGRDPEAILPGALFYSVIHAERGRAYELAENLRRRDDWAPFSVPEMAERGIAIIGNPEDCGRAIRRYIEAGIRYFTLGIVPIREADAIIEGLQLYAEKVLPMVADL